MNKINSTRIAVFVVFQVVACFLAWLGGYDFDSRNALVAYMAGVSITFGALAAAYPGLGEDR
jgi:hypothetical protein